MKKKNVLILSGFMADTYTSIEKQYVEFASSQQSNSSLNFFWLVPDHGKQNASLYAEKLQEIGATIIRSDLSPRKIIASYFQLRTIIRKYNIDLVWTHFGVERYLGLFLAKIAGAKTVLNVHGEYFAKWRKGVLLKKICVFLFADAFIAVSEYVAKPFRRYGKTFVLHNSFISDSFPDLEEADTETFRNKYGIAKDKKIISMVAAFRPEKRHSLAIDIFEILHKKHPDTCLFFAGDGQEFNNVVEYITKKKLNDHIILSGHITELNELYSVSLISLLTSRNEPFGMVILEAMYKKLPIVAVNSGGPTEIFSDNIDGFLIEPNDIQAFSNKLSELLENEPLRVSIGENAKQKVVANYLFEAWCTKQTDILNSILN